MKKALLTLAAAGLVSSLAAYNSIVAVKVKEGVSDITPKSELWRKADMVEKSLYPQTTLMFNDAEAMDKNSDNSAKKVQVGALYDDEHIAFKVKWFDGTGDKQGRCADTFADGFALQLAVDYTDASQPYIGMGDKNREVVVHLVKNTASLYEPNGKGEVKYQVASENLPLFGDELRDFELEKIARGNEGYVKSFIAKGFRTTTEIRDGSVDISGAMSYDAKTGIWEGVVVRPIKDSYIDLDTGAFPLAVAVWDGSKDNRDGLKHISSWMGVKTVDNKGGFELLESLNKEAKGDIENGKKVALENCASCHRYTGAEAAPEYMAPNLKNIGGYTNYAYLKESIIAPSAVVVPGYNRNAHPMYAWYTVDEDGNRNSTMPPYNWLDEKSIEDLIAFLQTLKEE